jgi:hypothetical protein
MLNRVMVVVLLGCLGLTAGLALGTVFASTNVSNTFTPARTWDAPPIAVMPPQSVASVYVVGNCHSGRLYSAPVQMPKLRVLHLQPSSLSDGGPSAPLAMGGYVLLGFLAGLSAALGFLVAPRSRVTAARTQPGAPN